MFPFTAKSADSKQPNIILMVADNLGRESVGYYGDKIFETPNLDRMASQGVVFDNCLIATPLCAPARCGWNTGRHPYRVGFNTQPVPSDPDSGVSTEEVTIAEVMRNAGYHTALFGKWNLGYDKKFNPLFQGFDEYYGSNAGHADYYTHLYNRDMRSHFFRDFTPVEDEGYFDELFTDEAVEFLKRRQGTNKPFYMNLCFYAPHGPYQAAPGYYHSNDPMENYRTMIEYLDTCVGRVLKTVNELGLADNTLIVFLSDQGASSMNDFKRDLAEGGLKVVCNAIWPGQIPAGARVKTAWVHYDLYTTFAAFAGAEIPKDRIVDGKDVRALFKGENPPNKRTVCWTYRNEDAVRIDNWKLHMIDGKVKGLYDLNQDPEERNDVSADHPDKIKKMQKILKKWKAECEANQTSTARSGKTYSVKNHNNNY
jgi:arylsulfatase A-like enzyme